jgi:hypothetical protein
MTLADRIAELIAQHGSLRAAARVLDCDAGYLSRLQSGEKDNPDDWLLRRMKLRRVVSYERTDTVDPTACLECIGMGCQACQGTGTVRRQYYYRTTGCTATDATDPACICWHDEGTGPRADADPGLLEWREVALGVPEVDGNPKPQHPPMPTKDEQK